MATVSNAAVNMGSQISLPSTESISFACTPKRGIARSYDNSIFIFLKTLRTCFP